MAVDERAGEAGCRARCADHVDPACRSETGADVTLASCIKAVLFQDPGHFPFSIRLNVTMRFDRDTGEDARITNALRQAGLWELVDALPDGLDTVVDAGFGGATALSGGQ